MPAVGSFTRPWEKVTAGVISIFILAALLAVGLAVGALIVYYWPDIKHFFNCRRTSAAWMTARIAIGGLARAPHALRPPIDAVWPHSRASGAT